MPIIPIFFMLFLQSMHGHMAHQPPTVRHATLVPETGRSGALPASGPNAFAIAHVRANERTNERTNDRTLNQESSRPHASSSSRRPARAGPTPRSADEQPTDGNAASEFDRSVRAANKPRCASRYARILGAQAQTGHRILVNRGIALVELGINPNAAPARWHSNFSPAPAAARVCRTR
ncbi:MAG: hypothetical protein H7306_01500 [Bacteriovorax sp.]|nr:hypothetical protein [Rhizobacter sp.]